MRIAVISDIHGNLNAFRAVLADIETQAVEDVVCLGDTVGYGPEPDECLRLLRAQSISMVLGNHEQALANPRCLDNFNPHAREALLHTATLVSDESMDFIRGLPKALVRHGARFVHGMPPDNPDAYLFQVDEHELRELFMTTPERLTFIGHTHDLALVRFDGGRVTQGELRPGLNPLVPACRYIINIGSVGQPRDGDNRAKWVLWDKKAHSVELRRVAYDYKDTAHKLIARGFNKRYANRLY